jgi:C4-dicarboxylate-specific signal transduction histidine kinase
MFRCEFSTSKVATTEAHDSGSGVAPSSQEKIFEPFSTAKPDGNGLVLLSLKIYALEDKEP